LAQRTGGRQSLQPEAAFDANLGSQGAVREIGLPLVWLALLLLPLDIALRRLLFTRDQAAAALRKIGLGWLAPNAAGDLRPPAQVVTSAQTPLSGQPPARAAKPVKTPKPAPDLERLREAQERARRRARGEE
jgi:hypothetical protein